MSKRDYDKKLREEQEATAHVFQDFIRVFQDVPTSSKTFVKSGILYGDKNVSVPPETQLYTPTPLIDNSAAMQRAIECAKIVKLDISKKNKNKQKSNLELLKEELKQRHSERDEREKLKEEMATSLPAVSYFEGGDPKSTNLFVANLNTTVTEMNLMEEFGAFGPLASVKIMWPRGEEKFKNLSTNCGFVAFMSRRDAERALNHMKHRIDMRVGWGKSVDLPAHPIYIPQQLLKLYLPPPQSGLPFNAQCSQHISEDIEEFLQNAVVKVTIPLNKKSLTLVNRMVEYVIKEGPLFEAMIMNREIQNPDYIFLFDNKSAIHLYYRWKLFSILQGEATRKWKTEPFRMFKGGSIWLPPVAPDYQAGMPEQLLCEKSLNSMFLSDNQCDRLIEIIRNLTLSRNSIAEGTVFCMNHLAALNDSLDIIADSLNNISTNPVSKIARLYLLSDVLSNCKLKNQEISDSHLSLETIFKAVKVCFDGLKNNADKMSFRNKALRVIQQMQFIKFMTDDFALKCEEYFKVPSDLFEEDISSGDEPLDGANLVKRSLKGRSDECIITCKELRVQQEIKMRQEYFVPSKWDTLDAEDVEAQAMSSAKLYRMEVEKEEKKCLCSRVEFQSELVWISRIGKINNSSLLPNRRYIQAFLKAFNEKTNYSSMSSSLSNTKRNKHEQRGKE